MLISADWGGRTGWRTLRLFAVAGAAWALTGCGGGNDAPLGNRAEPGLGRLSIPLDTTGSSGALYRLSASLQLTGPQTETLLLSGAVPSVELELASGGYQASLLEPWRLSRVDADRPRAVDATLISENPASVQIEPNRTTQLVLRFRVDGGEVVPADDGNLSVIVEVEDTPPGGGACNAPSAGLCVEQLLDEALLALGSAPGCVPAQALPTPLGNVQLCSEGVCAGGVPGCPIADLDLAVATQVAPGGAIEVRASAALRSPLVVPVRLPPLLGGGTCRPEVSASFPGLFVTVSRVDAGGGQVALEMGGVSVEPSLIDVQGGGCEAFLGAFPALVEQELQSRISELVLGGLPELVKSLTCTECLDGCALRCLSSP